MIAVTGYRSTIITELSEYDDVERIPDFNEDGSCNLPDTDNFVLCAGVIYNKTALEQTPEEIATSMWINGFCPIRLCELILSTRPSANIVVVGSQSGIKGSYDMNYACAKAAIHFYVKTKLLSEGQRLCCVAPGIILDTNMTRNRHDYEEIKSRPLLRARQVAQVIYEQLRKGDPNSILSIGV